MTYTQLMQMQEMQRQRAEQQAQEGTTKTHAELQRHLKPGEMIAYNGDYPYITTAEAEFDAMRKKLKRVIIKMYS